ncbi:MAG: hypothetical protein ABII01_00720 [Candidatus Woesearchaeota archaeon]
MKEIIFSVFVILLILTISCTENVEQTNNDQNNRVQDTEIQESLSELQIEACNAADNAKTCESRLPEVGIVKKEECCKILGKCC